MLLDNLLQIIYFRMKQMYYFKLNVISKNVFFEMTNSKIRSINSKIKGINIK